VGVPYQASFTGSGGVAPYNFLVEGPLPAGLTLNRNGSVRGTPLATGTSSFDIRIVDGLGHTMSTPCGMDVVLPDLPSFSLSDVPATVNPASTGPSISFQLSRVYTLPIQGQLTLTIAAETENGDGALNQPDPRVRFSNGQTTFNFTIPAGQRQAITGISSTGTVASKVTISVSSLTIGGSKVAAVPPAKMFQIARLIPVLTDACFKTRKDGLDVSITGYTTTRQLSSAAFTFTPASGGSSQTATVDLAGSSAGYFGAAESIRKGGAFNLAIPFDVLGGDVSTASFTLANSVGTTASRQLTRCQ
jgi:hypothetical protein